MLLPFAQHYRKTNTYTTNKHKNQPKHTHETRYEPTHHWDAGKSFLFYKSPVELKLIRSWLDSGCLNAIKCYLKQLVTLYICLRLSG